MPRSKLQQQILKLYGDLLRATKSQPSLQSHITSQFKSKKNLPRTKLTEIEYHFRLGQKRLNDFKGTEAKITNFTTFNIKK